MEVAADPQRQKPLFVVRVLDWRKQKENSRSQSGRALSATVMTDVQLSEPASADYLCLSWIKV
jgi:hypothetical protein